MNERKSWASSPEAKKSHAIFECPTHHLQRLFEKHMEATEGLRDEVEEKKRTGRIKSASGEGVQTFRNFINSALTRATQRTQRFVRWIRNRLYHDAPWSNSLARLRKIWALPSASFSTPILCACRGRRQSETWLTDAGGKVMHALVTGQDFNGTIARTLVRL